MLGLGGLDFSMRCKAVRSKTNNLLRTYSSMKQGKKGELAGRKQLCTVLRVGVDPLMDSPFSLLRCGLRFQMMPQPTNDDAYCLQQQFQNISSTSKVGSYTFHYYRDFESIEG